MKIPNAKIRFIEDKSMLSVINTVKHLCRAPCHHDMTVLSPLYRKGLRHADVWSLFGRNAL